jgi:hypothetical protein
MSIQNAIGFIENIKEDTILRRKINCLKPEDIHPFLEINGYSFSYDQFEDAINVCKLKCGSEQDAFDIDEIKFWFLFLSTIFQNK